MKFISKLAAGVVAAALAGQASAATITINITGATSFRSAVNAALLAQFTGKTGFGYRYVGTDFPGASQAVFTGVLVAAGDTYVVRTSFSGSGSGMAAIQAGTNQSFIPAAAATATTDAAAQGYASTFDSVPAKFAFSDVYPGTAGVSATGLVEANSGNPVAVGGFKFMTNFGGPALNITSQNFRAFANNPGLSQDFFDGSGNSTPVYLIGRDNGSGTRLTVLAETGYGVGNAISQKYGSSITGAVTTNNYAITGLADVPAGTGNFTSATARVNRATAAGNGGYNSGGDVVKTLAADYSNVTVTGAQATTGTVIALGYAGTADAATAANYGRAPVECKYNGATYSDTAVYSGVYTLWCYEHFYSKGAVTTAESLWLNGTNQFLSKFELNLGTAGLPFGSMNVSRSDDGAVVGP
jgi:hypothetical protein